MAHPTSASTWLAPTGDRSYTLVDAPDEVRAFHAALPGYVATPLTELPALASELGVGRVLVKDESARLGLPAFKILGASWAVASAIARDASSAAVPVSLSGLRELTAALPDVELVTATDGNHGRAVARMAALLDVRACVLLPDVAEPAAVEAIVAEGAEVRVVSEGYDDTVRRAAEYADADPARLLVQDTAWEGYDQVPSWVVQGYSTLFREVDEQLAAVEAAADLVAIPVGVGSLAQAAVTHYRREGLGHRPALLGVEPDTAACTLRSMQRDGRVSVATGHTVMAGLNCGTLSSTAWPVLRDGLDAAVVVTDQQARTAVTDLSAAEVSAGPSGAASLAGVRSLLTGPGGDEHRSALTLDSESVLVLLSTEGAGTARGGGGG